MNDAARDGAYDTQNSGFLSVNPGESFTFTTSNPVNGANGSAIYIQSMTVVVQMFGLPGTFTYTVPSGTSFVLFEWYATKNGVHQSASTATWAISCTPAP
jgi:hypothetical protein